MKRQFLTLFTALLITGGVFAQEPGAGTLQPDEMPYFPGCDKYKKGSDEKRNCSNAGVISFISNYLQYPELAKEEQVEGTVMVGFVVKASGEVAEVRILNEIGGDCELAALEVMKKMPRWQPAMLKGKPVDARLRLPVQFSLATEADFPNDNYKIRWGDIKGDEVTKKQLLANLENPIEIWDNFGNVIPHIELMFIYEKGKGVRDASSNGKLSKRQRRMIKFLRKGGDFIIGATLLIKGEFVYVEQVYKVS